MESRAKLSCPKAQTKISRAELQPSRASAKSSFSSYPTLIENSSFWKSDSSADDKVSLSVVHWHTFKLLEFVLCNLTECIFVDGIVFDFLFSELWNFPLFFGGKIQSLLNKKSKTIPSTKIHSVRLKQTDSRDAHFSSRNRDTGNQAFSRFSERKGIFLKNFSVFWSILANFGHILVYINGSQGFAQIICLPFGDHATV